MKSAIGPRIFAFLRQWLRQPPLGLAFGLGLVLRLIGINSRSLQYDDVFSVFLSARSLPEIVAGTAADTMPPLYYFLLHFWMLIGQSAVWIRLLSVLLSLAAVALLYFLALAWFGRAAAGWAALLAAISPLMIYHGQDVRMYALLITTQLAYLLFFTHIWLSGSSGRASMVLWVGLVLCGALAMYSHNVGVFALGIPNLFLLFRREWKLFVRVLLAQVGIGLLALPWLLQLPTQIAKVQQAWTLPRPGLVELVQVLLMFHASLPLPSFLMVAALGLSVFCVIVMILELRRGRKSLAASMGNAGMAVQFWLVALIFPLVILFVISYIMRPVFVPRTLLVSALAYEVLAGWVIARGWAQGVGKVLAVTFVLAALISLPVFYTFDDFPRSPYRAGAQSLMQMQLPVDAIVVHETKLSYFPMRFYAPDLPQVFLKDDPGSPNDTFTPGSQRAMQIFPQPDMAAAVGTHPKVIFITFHQVFEEYRAAGESQDPHLLWLDAHYHQTQYQAFNDLDVFTYQRYYATK